MRIAASRQALFAGAAAVGVLASLYALHAQPQGGFSPKLGPVPPTVTIIPPASGTLKAGPQIDKLLMSRLLVLDKRVTWQGSMWENDILFMLVNGQFMDLEPGIPFGYQASEEYRRHDIDSFDLLGYGVDWYTINNILYGFLSARLDISYANAFWGADINNRRKGWARGEGDRQKGAYLFGYEMYEDFVSNPQYANNALGFRQWFAEDREAQYYLQMASIYGRIPVQFKNASVMNESHIFRDFSQMPWETGLGGTLDPPAWAITRE